MKKLSAIIILSLIATTVFAAKKWKFTDPNDGRVFLIGLYSDHSVKINIDPFLDNGKPADPLNVNCNATTYHLTAGSSIICYPNFNDISNMSILPGDFKNGSQGTYDYLPLDHKAK
ncbi:MAG: hypothetical protein KIT56_02400 [Gammaproteobacteria bacterium]|nr:hypothetical protein [Gammaproteobacteria bacterium]MCW5582729.1 hypothetical protein [Gammaproteobacteria bacterium]